MLLAALKQPITGGLELQGPIGREPFDTAQQLRGDGRGVRRLFDLAHQRIDGDRALDDRIERGRERMRRIAQPDQRKRRQSSDPDVGGTCLQIDEPERLPCLSAQSGPARIVRRSISKSSR